MSDDAPESVTAAGLLPTEEQHRALLQSIVDTARAIFRARATSVFLHDEEADELVFEAVSGEGQRELIGSRVPSSTGIAGFVLVTRQLLVVDDVQSDPRFARSAAAATGYVPRTIASAPLLAGDRALGVLSVLDRDDDVPFGVEGTNLLTLFAHQAAIGLDLLASGRRARRIVESGDDRLAVVARLTRLLDGADDPRAGLKLLEALERVLRDALR